MVGARLQLWALVALAFVAGLFGIYAAGVKAGAERVRQKIDAKRLADLKTAKGIEDEIESLDDPYLAERASKWLRGDNR